MHSLGNLFAVLKRQQYSLFRCTGYNTREEGKMGLCSCMCAHVHVYREFILSPLHFFDTPVLWFHPKAPVSLDVYFPLYHRVNPIWSGNWIVRDHETEFCHGVWLWFEMAHNENAFFFW